MRERKKISSQKKARVHKKRVCKKSKKKKEAQGGCGSRATEKIQSRWLVLLLQGGGIDRTRPPSKRDRVHTQKARKKETKKIGKLATPIARRSLKRSARSPLLRSKSSIDRCLVIPYRIYLLARSFLSGWIVIVVLVLVVISQKFIASISFSSRLDQSLHRHEDYSQWISWYFEIKLPTYKKWQSQKHRWQGMRKTQIVPEYFNNIVRVLPILCCDVNIFITFW